MDQQKHLLHESVIAFLGILYNCRQVSHIRRTLGGNQIVDHSDVVGASPVGAAPTTSSFSTHLTLGFNILCKGNCKPRRGTFKFGDLVRLMFDILRYLYMPSIPSLGTHLVIYECPFLILWMQKTTHATPRGPVFTSWLLEKKILRTWAKLSSNKVGKSM